MLTTRLNIYKLLRLSLTLLLLMLTIATSTTTQAQLQIEKGERYYEKDRLFKDSIFGGDNYTQKLHNSQQIYDSIYLSKSKFLKLIAPLLITSPQNLDQQPLTLPTLEVGRHYYARYDQMTIAQIDIIQADVFQKIGEEPQGFSKLLDKIHILTQQKQIAQNLLFKIGDQIDP